MEYLVSLFGPEVEEVLDRLQKERERVAQGEKSEMLDLLISRKWLDMFGPFDKHPREVGGNPVQMVTPGVMTGKGGVA